MNFLQIYDIQLKMFSEIGPALWSVGASVMENFPFGSMKA